MKTSPGRSTRLLLVSVLLALGLAGMAQAQDAPTIPLPMNETIIGTLGSGESIVYSFEVPVDQDMIVAFEADKTLWDFSCVTLTTPSSQEEQCEPRGGSGGSDPPTSRVRIFPPTDQPDAHQTVAMELVRPRDSPVNYQIIAYPVTLPVLQPGEQLDVDVEADSPSFQVYALEADPEQPFTIQISDAGDLGDFLTLNYDPTRYPASAMLLSEGHQLLYQFATSAWYRHDSEGTSWISADYHGGNTFRVHVELAREAVGDYSILFSPHSSVPIPLDQPVTGTLASSRQIVYRFDMPVGQDVLFTYQSDKQVFPEYCITVTAPTPQEKQCDILQGGGGGDSPSSRAFAIPAMDQPDIRQTVELALMRSTGFEGPAHYTVFADAFAPQVVEPGVPLPVAVDPDQPYQAYALDTDLTQPFVVQIEDADDDGTSLWVANEPYRNRYPSIDYYEDRQLFPQDVAYVDRYDNPQGISKIRLHYFGGTTFRVRVQAAGDYTLRFTPLESEPLAEDSERLVTISHQNPLQLIALDADVGDRIELAMTLVDGQGVQAYVYELNNPGTPNALALGQAGGNGQIFPLSDTIELPATVSGQFIAAVQIPWDFTRGEVTVAVSWTRASKSED